MKKAESIAGAALAVSLLVILGKLLGFGREALIAAYYGATAETDAFFFAQGMPGTIFPAVCNSISTAFVSLYVKRMTEEGEGPGDRYASRMLLCTSLLGVALGLLGAALSPVLVPLFAPGFSGAQLTLAVYLTRLTMGAFVLTMLQYMLSAVLNSKKLFVGSQVAGLLYNTAIIAVTVLLGRGQSMTVLTLTVILGMLVQVAALVLCCRGHFIYTHGLTPFHSDTRRLLRMALPILLGNSVVQLNHIVDKALGSMLPEGSLSALSYANSLTTVVVSVFIISLSTVLYPTLTTDAAKGYMDRFGETLLQSIGVLSLLLIPISCITLLDAPDIVSAVYARGSFDQTAVSYTAVALACYAPMFFFSGIREVFSRAFFALQDTKTPMRNGAIGVGCNIVFSLVFVRWLGLAGIALGTTLSIAVIAGLLLRSAHKHLPELRLDRFFTSVGKQLLAGAVLMAALVAFRRAVSIPWPLLRFAADTAVGFLVYLLALLPLRCRELQSMMDLLRQKLRR